MRQCGERQATVHVQGLGSKDDMGIVLKPIVLQGCINCRSVSADRAAWRDVFLYKRNDCFDGGCSNALKANTPKALGLMHLNGNGDRYQMAAVMGFGAWGPGVFRVPSAQCQEDFINFDSAT